MTERPGLEPSAPPHECGRALRKHWSLADDAIFLNRGSYGACPLVVQHEQERIRREMEAPPDDFFYSNIVPKDAMTPLARTAADL